MLDAINRTPIGRAHAHRACAHLGAGRAVVLSLCAPNFALQPPPLVAKLREG